MVYGGAPLDASVQELIEVFFCVPLLAVPFFITSIHAIKSCFYRDMGLLKQWVQLYFRQLLMVYVVMLENRSPVSVQCFFELFFIMIIKS
jgi:hypothetical protein